MNKTDDHWVKEVQKRILDFLIAVLIAIPAEWLLAVFGNSRRQAVVEVSCFAFLVVAARHFRVLARIRAYLAVRRTGLKGIWQRGSSAEPGRLLSLFEAARAGDTILIVGRTHHELLHASSGLLEAALERGVTIQLMMLNRATIANPTTGPRIDLRPLGIDGASTLLQKDLSETEGCLVSLRRKCDEKRWRGSLLVYRTTVLIQNSAVILVPSSGSAARMIYDFSFGADKQKKWSHYYEKKERPGTFTTQLKDFYADMFNQQSSSFYYSLSYDAGLPVETVAINRMRKLIADHSEAEAVRENTLSNLMPAAAAVFESMSRPGTSRTAPISVQVELTNRCSTRCEHCSRFKTAPPQASRAVGDLPVVNQPAETGPAEKDLDVELAEALFKELARLGTKTLTFSGGEPTQHPQFIRLLQFASSHGLRVGVLSNGVGLSEQVRDALDNYAAWLRLSIDGSNAEEYAKVRKGLLRNPRDAFDEVIDTVKWFSDLGVKRCKLAICYTIQRQNAKDVTRMIDYIETCFPDLLENMTFKFAHAGNDGTAASYVCSAEDIRLLYKSVLQEPKYRGKANMRYLCWLIEKQFGISDLSSGHPTRSLYLESRPQCFTPYLFSVVDAQGGVYPCCFLYEDNRSYDTKAAECRHLHLMGNIKDGFQKAWEGQPYEQARRELRAIDPADKYEACSRCTRHANHNIWLSRVHEEYEQLRHLRKDASKILRASAQKSKEDVWV